jgi:AraC-like DNA-binding protein
MDATDLVKLPFSIFSTDDIDPRDRWAIWQDSISTIFDVAPVAGYDATFAASVHAHLLQTLVFGDTHFTAQTFDRSPLKIARDGLDHFLIQIYLNGGYAGEVGRNKVDVRPGDVCILDLGQTLTTQSTASRTLSLVIPRDTLEATLPGASLLHGSVLRRESGLGMLLGDHLKSLFCRLPTVPQADAVLIQDTVLQMVSACFRPTVASLTQARAPIEAVTQAKIMRYIEDNLAKFTLAPQSISRALGISRTTLYRLFEQIGGVTSYIQRRRVTRAYAALIHPANRLRRIYDIGFDLGFASEGHFSRSVRKAYGFTPSDIRAMSLTSRSLLPYGNGPQGVAKDDYTHWIMLSRQTQIPELRY